MTNRKYIPVFTDLDGIAGITPEIKLLYGLLWSMRGPDGVTCVSSWKLQTDLKCARRSVWRWLNVLVRADVIRVERCAGKPNAYSFPEAS